jgi:hypothetical protein
VVVSPCLETGDTLQQWYFDDTGHGFHRPVVKQANLALEIENDEGVRGTNVVGGYRRDGTNSAGNLTQAGKWPPQQWRFAMIDDTTAPSLSVSASPSTLWPANHKLVTVNISIDVSDNLDPQPEVTLLSVVSSEPDSGAGDTTQGDIVIVDNQTLQLRAERTGKDNGRIYTITYEATDAYGNSTTASTTVTVPHNQGPGNSGNSTEALSDDELPFRAFIPVIQQ